MEQTISAFQQSLIAQLEFSQWVLETNLTDVSNEDSLRQPMPGGNCLNWVIGHIVYSRYELLEVFGAVTAEEKSRFARYKRGSNAITGGSDSPLAIAALVDELRKIHPLYLELLSSVSPEQLTEKAPPSPANNRDGTYGSLLSKFAFHEHYHVGQTGILRRLAGKEGMIR